MSRKNKGGKTAKIPLDAISHKRGRGRPQWIDPNIVRRSADSYRILLERNWGCLEYPLLAAQTEQEVVNALQSALPAYDHEIIRLAPLILKVGKDTRFPKRSKARIRFLADSIGGSGTVTPRRSRDICAEERAADAHRHMILRHEYWIECSCGYKGRSENHSCKNCGAVLYGPELGIHQYN